MKVETSLTVFLNYVNAWFGNNACAICANLIEKSENNTRQLANHQEY